MARVYEGLQTHKGDRAARTCWKYDNWDYNYVQTYIRSIGKVWYVWLVKHTSGNALSRLKAITKSDKGLSWDFRGSVMSS